MTDFEVVYQDQRDKTQFTISKVYGVNDYNFLISNGNGRFRWVPIQYCMLKASFDAEKERREQEEAKRKAEETKSKSKTKFEPKVESKDILKWYNEFLKDLGGLFDDNTRQ